MQKIERLRFNIPHISYRFMLHLHSWDCILLLNPSPLATFHPCHLATILSRPSTRHFVSYGGEWYSIFANGSPLKLPNDNILWTGDTLPPNIHCNIRRERFGRNSIWNSSRLYPVIKRVYLHDFHDGGIFHRQIN